MTGFGIEGGITRRNTGHGSFGIDMARSTGRLALRSGRGPEFFALPPPAGGGFGRLIVAEGLQFGAQKGVAETRRLLGAQLLGAPGGAEDGHKAKEGDENRFHGASSVRVCRKATRSSTCWAERIGCPAKRSATRSRPSVR